MNQINFSNHLVFNLTSALLPSKVTMPHALQMTRDKPTEPDLFSTPPGVIKIPEPLIGISVDELCYW